MNAPEHVRIPCPECDASVKVRTGLLGEWVTCPKCAQDFVAKDNSAPRAKARPAPRDDRDDEDDRERTRNRARDDDREDRARRGSGRRREEDDEEEDEYERGPRPETCPKCRSERFGKVRYTWWGGLVGPAVFSLVKCQRCGKQYNRKTGKALGLVHIAVYTLVILAICGGVVLALAVAAG